MTHAKMIKVNNGEFNAQLIEMQLRSTDERIWEAFNFFATLLLIALGQIFHPRT